MSCQLKQFNQNTLQLIFKRYGHTLRGKPPGVARSLEQRLTG